MTKKGWALIIGTAILVVLLIAGGIYYAKKPNAWPVSIFQKEDVQIVRKADRDDRKDDFADKAARTIFEDKKPVPVSDYSYDATGKTGYTSWTQEVKIGLIIANEYDVKNVISGSCGDVYMVTYRVPGPSVLTNSMRALFGDKVFGDFLPGNIIPSYHPKLSFKSAAIEGGVAKIYLTGEFDDEHDGSCDKSLALAQISETAKSFATVKSVQVYLGNSLIHTSSK